MIFIKKAVGLFITGTDTEIGKTEIACAIAKKGLLDNLKLSVRKPVASGCLIDGESSSCQDTRSLKQASQSIDDYATITPYSFKQAVAPPIAAKSTNKELNIEMLVQSCQMQRDDFLMVEGVGGLASPIALDGDNSALAVKLKLPLVVVVGSRLGCVNHTLLTLNYLQKQGLILHSVVLNDIDNNPTAQQQHSEMIKQFSNLDKLYNISYYNPQTIENEKRWSLMAEELTRQGWRF